MKIANKHVGCLNCGGTEDILPLNTVLYYGFGGYAVYKNGKHFYSGDPQGEWKSYKKLLYIEKIAAKSMKAQWEVRLDNPLRGATWRRRAEGVWVLTETNRGFA